jgi:hypothetical protein
MSDFKAAVRPWINEIRSILAGMEQDFLFQPTEEMRINTGLRFRNIERACKLANEALYDFETTE